MGEDTAVKAGVFEYEQLPGRRPAA